MMEVHTTPVGVALIETSTGRFVRINQRYCDIVGFTLPEMLRTTFHAITHPEDLQEDLANAAARDRREHQNRDTCEAHHTFPLFRCSVHLVQEAVLDGTPKTQAALRGQESVTLKGAIEYQACDDTICYNPESVPLSWTLALRPLVTERPPRPDTPK